MITLGAVPPNQKDILKRGGGAYKMRKPNAIPGGGAMPLDRKKAEAAASFKNQGAQRALQSGKKGVGNSRAGLTYGAGHASSGATDDTSVKILDAGSGTSIFDPVLCEIAYRWFSPSGGIVLDPFAGGSVRGIVAGKLGRSYFGCDLSARQIEANQAQLSIMNQGEINPVWKRGDSTDIQNIFPSVAADFLFSCPPYADLEVYSEDPLDLSTMAYRDFLEVYRRIITASCGMLKSDRFACFVVGEVRGKNGDYYNFVGDTIKAFMDAGLSYYNEAILLTMIGSLPIRAGRAFSSSRKLGKTHQNVLVFVKGDPKKAAQACGKVEFDESLFGEPSGDNGESP